MDNIKNKTESGALKTKSRDIPNGFKLLLWSKDIKNIDAENDKIYIIHQVLSYGSIEDIKLLLKIYSKEEIKNIFINYPKRVYTRQIFLFLKDFLLKLDLELDEQNYVKKITRAVK